MTTARSPSVATSFGEISGARSLVRDLRGKDHLVAVLCPLPKKARVVPSDSSAPEGESAPAKALVDHRSVAAGTAGVQGSLQPVLVDRRPRTMHCRASSGEGRWTRGDGRNPDGRISFESVSITLGRYTPRRKILDRRGDRSFEDLNTGGIVASISGFGDAAGECGNSRPFAWRRSAIRQRRWKAWHRLGCFSNR